MGLMLSNALLFSRFPAARTNDIHIASMFPRSCLHYVSIHSDSQITKGVLSVDRKLSMENPMNMGETGNSGRNAGFGFPVIKLSFVISLIAIWLINSTLGTLVFLLGYGDFVTGAMHTPFTTFSIGGMAVVVVLVSYFLRHETKKWLVSQFILAIGVYVAASLWNHSSSIVIIAMASLVILVLLFLTGESDGLIVGIVTALSSVVLFEYLWDLFFLAPGPYVSWFGFGPFWTYTAAFGSLIALVFIGIPRWNLSLLSIPMAIAFPVSFTLWYLFGYPQPWDSATLDASFAWNMSVKMLSFVFVLAPYAGYFRKPSFVLSGNSCRLVTGTGVKRL